jgi:hypothetical protein
MRLRLGEVMGLIGEPAVEEGRWWIVDEIACTREITVSLIHSLCSRASI